MMVALLAVLALPAMGFEDAEGRSLGESESVVALDTVRDRFGVVGAPVNLAPVDVTRHAPAPALRPIPEFLVVDRGAPVVEARVGQVIKTRLSLADGHRVRYATAGGPKGFTVSKEGEVDYEVFAEDIGRYWVEVVGNDALYRVQAGFELRLWPSDGTGQTPVAALELDLEPYPEAASLGELIEPAARPGRVRKRRGNGPLVPPTRLDVRASFRDGLAPGSVAELGVQFHRSTHWTHDFNVAYEGGHRFNLQGPFRTMSGVAFTTDANRELNRWVTIGPSAGVTYRLFRQQFTTIGESWVPVVGLRTSAALLRARKWSIVMSGRVFTDLVQTRIVLETAEIRNVSPIEAQAGIRVNFGHGRVDPK